MRYKIDRSNGGDLEIANRPKVRCPAIVRVEIFRFRTAFHRAFPSFHPKQIRDKKQFLSGPIRRQDFFCLGNEFFILRRQAPLHSNAGVDDDAASPIAVLTNHLFRGGKWTRSKGWHRTKLG